MPGFVVLTIPQSKQYVNQKTHLSERLVKLQWQLLHRETDLS